MNTHNLFSKKIIRLVSQKFFVALTVAALLLSSVPAPAYAVIYSPGATLNPTCLPTDTNCGVDVNNLRGQLSAALTGTVSVSPGSSAVTGSSTAFTAELSAGDAIKIGSDIFTVASISSNTALTLSSVISTSTATTTGATAYRDPFPVFSVSNGAGTNLLTLSRAGLLALVNALTLSSSTPTSMANALYNQGGTLFWNGNAVAGLSGPSAITSLNGLTTSTQTFVVGTTGADFGITSSGSVHTFNLPSASGTARGLISTSTQTFAGDKTFGNALIVNGASTLATTTASSLTLSPMTSGSILFAGTGGLVSQNNANLFWDNINNRLGIGTTTPGATLGVAGTLAVTTQTSFSATGGTITTSGGYTIHTFTTSGTFTPNVAGTVEYLVVGGGGGGGSAAGGGASGGGGGAGGMLTNTGFGVTAQSYSITVGAGGVGGTSNGNGTNGSNSVFSTITASGGGGGGGSLSIGLAGGSGGGGGASSAGGAGTASQGNNGGIGFGTGALGAGGGGGAGAVGSNGTGSVGGNGGTGLPSSISGSAVTYAGGGGGGIISGSGGVGGTGGGGAGGSSTTAGMANTGGGGGGANAGVLGSAGGSGIVIIRYLTPVISNALTINSNALVVNSGNNVGIGTSTPSQALSVVGNILGSGALTISGTSTLAITTATGLTISQNGLTLASSTPTATASTLYNQGNTLYWNGSTVGLGGVEGYTTQTVTSNTTLTSWGNIVYVDASAGAVTITLPASASNTNKAIRFYRLDSSTNAIVIQRAGSEVFQQAGVAGVSMLVLKSGQGQITDVRSNGSNPEIINGSGIASVQRLWLPSDAASAPTVWFKPDALLTAGALVSWSDSSGNGNNAAQATSARQPIVTLNSLNGYSQVGFTASSQQYMTVASMNAGGLTAATVFSVIKQPATAATNSNDILGDTVSNTAGFVFATGGPNADFKPVILVDGVAWITGATSALTASAWGLSGVTWNSAGADFYTEGKSAEHVTASIPVAGTGNAVTLGARVGGGFYRNAPMAEIIEYSAILTQSDMDKLAGYAAYKYGLQANLPSGHTYKTNPPAISQAYTPLTLTATSVGIGTTNPAAQFQNTGSTLFGAATAIANKLTGGTIGTAATTVDIATNFNVAQTTTGQALTLPNPTDTTSGRIVIVNNTGAASFTMSGVTMNQNNSTLFIWNGTAWSVDAPYTNAFSDDNIVWTGTNTFNQSVTFNQATTFSQPVTYASISIADLPTGGAIGTASTTVDVASSITLNQTTAGQTLSLPAPTETAAGRIVYVSNVGTVSFLMFGGTVNLGTSVAAVWNGSAWSPSGSGSASTVTTVDYLGAQLAADVGMSGVGTTIAFTQNVTGNIPMSSGIITLSAGKTYYLQAVGKMQGVTGPGFSGFNWMDATTNTGLPGFVETIITTLGTNGLHNTGVNSGFYTPTTNQTIKLAVSTAGNSGSQTMLTNGSEITVKQIGSTASTGVSIDLLSDALAAKTLDNTNFGQTWNWSKLATDTGMTMAANALTTGSLLALMSSNGTLNSTNGLLYVANTGVSLSGTVARIQSNSTAGSGLTVLANGNVGINNTSPSSLLQVVGGGLSIPISLIQNGCNGCSAENGLRIQYTASNTSLTAGNKFIDFTTTAGNAGSISLPGTTGLAVAYNTASDARLKENITTTTLGLSDLLRLSVSDFSFVNDPSHQKMTGFIAQDLNSIFPDAVTTNGDDGATPLGASSTPWMVDYGRVTPLIVKSIQDQQLEIAGLTGNSSLVFASSTDEIPSGADMNPVADVIAYITGKISAGIKIVRELVTERIVAVTGYFKRIFANELCLTDSSGQEVCITGDQLKNIGGTQAASSPQVGSTPSTTLGTSPLTTDSTTQSSTSSSSIATPQPTPSENPPVQSDTSTSTESNETSTPPLKANLSTSTAQNDIAPSAPDPIVQLNIAPPSDASTSTTSATTSTPSISVEALAPEPPSTSTVVEAAPVAEPSSTTTSISESISQPSDPALVATDTVPQN